MTGPRPVPDLIEQWAAERPDRPALVGPHGVTTYGDLWADARAWAGAVGELAGPDRIVGVLRSRDALVPVVQLAAWLSGAAYLPLDPSLPRGRLATILRESGCTVVCTTDDLRSRLPGDVVAVTRPGPAVPPKRRHAKDLAYVIYTSGSSGVPKGVEIEHGNLATLMRWYRDFYRMGPHTRTSMFANLGFDCLVIDVWTALYAGGAVAIPDQAVLDDPHRMARFLDEHDVAHADMPTAMYERYLASGARSTALRVIETGGDQLRLWPPPDYPAAVFNGYGPTEATVQVTISGDLRTGSGDGLPPIGRPLPGVTIRLLDESGAEVSQPGDVGELVIYGDLVGRGYRNRPELTAAVFADGPPRSYRTGDLCRWTADGELAYLGRIDSQVQLRGYRVEPGEIEQQMMLVPGVELAAVAPVGDGPHVSLRGWVAGHVDVDAVLAHLRHTLPAYMVPDPITVLDALPMTVNGKVDRRSLAASVGS